MRVSKVVVLGLDGFSPELVERWLEDLPNLKKLQQQGIWGTMESTVPPSTYPAWTCAQTGHNPGTFGFWDFSYRDDFSYGQPKLIDCTVRDKRVDCLYKILPILGQKVAMINAPLTWPPPRIPGGYSISSFMTPGLDRGFTWPESLKDEVYRLVGKYIIDASEPGVNYLQIEKDKVLRQIYDMDSQRFTLCKHFFVQKQCDYVFAMITGCDRMSHLFYRYLDEHHRRYDPDTRYANVLHDYYVWIDKHIGETYDVLNGDTVLFVHSAHGVQRLDGLINLNEWLIQEGYMVLHEYPSEHTPLTELKTDWSKTKAWATGNTGQIYLNVKGREPQGIVDPDDYDSFLDELADKLIQIPDEQGNSLKTRVFKRKEIHSGPFAQYGPDLFILFDEYLWNTSEMVGYGRGNLYSFDKPSGPDDGADGLNGYFCIAGPGVPASGKHTGATLLDVAPTVLDVMDLEIPKEMEGKSLLGEEKPERPPEDHEKMRSRLKALGY